MNTTAFRRQAKELGFGVRKQRGLEALHIMSDGTELCTIYYAELHAIAHASEILAKKLRPEYIPPLG